MATVSLKIQLWIYIMLCCGFSDDDDDDGAYLVFSETHVFGGGAAVTWMSNGHQPQFPFNQSAWRTAGQ